MRIAAPSADSVGTLARSGLPWSSLRLFLQYLLRVISAAVLARILTPEDYGLFGMAAVVIAFLHTFADAGLGLATIQKKELSEQQVHNLFWVNLTLGIVLCLVTMASAPLVADFFKREELSGLLTVLAIGFVFGGIAVQPAALLRRAIRTQKIVLIDVVSEGIGYVVAILMAVNGAGFWALAGHSLASTGLRTLLLLHGARYRPRSPARRVGTLSLVQFGGYVGAFAVVNYFARNMDNVLIGRILGAEDLGFYSRAYFLMTLPNMIVTASLSEVMIPSLSALQDDSERFVSAYRKVISMVALTALPIAFGLAVTASGVVRLVYGPQWHPVATLLMLLGIAAGVQPVMSTAGWIYVALGHGREMFLAGSATSAVIVLSFVVGIQWGAVGVAAAYAITNLLLAIPVLWIAHRAAAIPLRPTLSAFVPFVLCATCMVAVVELGGRGVTFLGGDWLLSFIVKVGIGVLVYGILVWAFCRETVVECIVMVRAMVGSRSS